MHEASSDGRGDRREAALRGAVIAGVIPGGDPAVVRTAASLAQLFGSPLVIAHVDTSRFVVAPDPDGYEPTNPAQAAGEGTQRMTDALRAEVGTILRDVDVSWSVLGLVGDPGSALHGLAERIDAAMFVIGTRRDDWGEALREFLEGSVAIRLARHQSRPIVVVPTGIAHPWHTHPQR